MNLQITKMDDTQLQFKPDGMLNTNLFNIYNENTFVFIEYSTYSKLSPSVKSESNTMSNDLTPEQMINEKILYCTYDVLDQLMIHEIIEIASLYAKRKIKYLMIKE